MTIWVPAEDARLGERQVLEIKGCQCLELPKVKVEKLQPESITSDGRERVMLRLRFRCNGLTETSDRDSAVAEPCVSCQIFRREIIIEHRIRRI